MNYANRQSNVDGCVAITGRRRKLRISRLWGATDNRVELLFEGLMHLVVATFQTLVRRVEAIGYEC